jgi:hypothetical protein
LELLINRYFFFFLVVCVICINDARSNKYQIVVESFLPREVKLPAQG